MVFDGIKNPNKMDGQNAFNSTEDFKNQEYETQFFGFTPRSFVDGMYNAVYDYLHDSLNTLQLYLCQQYSCVMPEDRIKTGSEVILQTMLNNTDKAFDRLESYLSTNVLRIPEHVLLPEDAIHETPHTIDEMQKLETDIQELKQRLQKAKKVNACLQKELKEQDVVKMELEKFISQLKMLKNLSRETGVFNWKENLVYSTGKAAVLVDSIKTLAGKS
ncbi:protein MIS12 homolog isoform X2 [Tachypleus tridentatus]|uniref:protein MIS12 homolog isoform X2 n=1 Tax=Tachypleus tridentatus TaxID=6853 RepID=UPI003FD57F2A